MKILVVEDFHPLRQIICSKLQSRPEYHVAQASDGLEAIQKAEELHPDLILLDIGLPSLSGIEVAKRVRTVAPRARIMFLTLESDPNVVRDALRVGALGYVHKPRIESDLLPAIDAVLAGERFVSSDLEFNVERSYRHEIIFSSEDAALQDGLASFIAHALNAGNAAIVWATESHRNNLLQKLQTRGVDVGAAIESGTYIAADAAEVADPADILARIRGLVQSASRAGKEHPRVAVCGERAGGFWKEGKPEQAIRLEQLFNQLANSRDDVDILCVYPLPRVQNDDDAFRRLCAEHTDMCFR